MVDAAPKRSPSPAGSRWRLVVFAAALLSLGPLWWISGASWGVSSDSAELGRAREARREGRHEEAWTRAERVLNRRQGATEGPERIVAAEAAQLASEARLENALASGEGEASGLEFAAWRARQAATFGANTVVTTSIRLTAARELRKRGHAAEGLAEMERLKAEGAATPETERERALAMAAAGGPDASGAIAVATGLEASARTQADRALALLTLGRVHETLGNAGRAAEAFGNAADLARTAQLPADAAAAGLGRARALLSLGRAEEAAPLLRGLLGSAPEFGEREEAGILLLEADAMSDEGAMAGDFLEFKALPAAPEALFAARARVAMRRSRAGRRSDAAATWAAAFEHLGARPFPTEMVSPTAAISDLTRLLRYGPDPDDLPALGVSCEGLASALPRREDALELAAEVAERRAAQADERGASARRAGRDGEAEMLEARALHGRAAEFRLTAADSATVVKSHSVSNRFKGGQQLFFGGWWESALPVLRRLADEIDATDDREAEVRWMEARTLQELGRHAEATAALARFLERHRSAPHWAQDAYVELARSQERLGQLEAAEKTLTGFLFGYDNVTPDAPRWREGLFALGDLQARLAADRRANGDDAGAAEMAAQAERNLADAVRRFPGELEPRFRAEMRLGLLAMSRRDWDAGVERLRSALAVPGSSGRLADAHRGVEARRASLLLGECLWQRGDTSEALGAFGQAWTTSASAETVAALGRLADCHERLGDSRQAARFRERAGAALTELKALDGGGKAGDAAEQLLERLVAGK